MFPIIFYTSVALAVVGVVIDLIGKCSPWFNLLFVPLFLCLALGLSLVVGLLSDGGI